VPTRPALRWHGGKWRLAPWIIQNFPPHRIYVEPFGGAASVLLRKPRAYAEIYNDLDADVVNLFCVLRSERCAELIRAVELTVFARGEFENAYTISACPVEQARRLIVRSFMGFGSDGFNRDVTTGFRANSNRSGTTPARDWMNFPEALRLVVERFRGVVIEQRHALQVTRTHDGPETLHYLDPPYLPSTRSQKYRKGKQYHSYNHEMDIDDHASLLAAIRTLDGAVVLSGYANELYDDALADWHRVTRETHADGARPRTEVLWLNGRARQLNQQQLLFDSI
jgi:DNA adenine methylase